jgi:universal stress protein A
MFDPKKILVPTDFSESSEKALKEAIDVAAKYHSKIYVLHVIDKAVQQCAADYCIPAEVMEQFEKESVNSSQKKMKEEVANLAGSKAVEIDFDIKKGVPFDEILKEQDERGIDLIIMATHGRTGLSKFMLGSVADKVLKKATAPVLLVRKAS